jgi:group I intron endonuclease
MENVFIYILIDPRNNQIKYVGKTNNLIRRLRRHISERFLRETHKDKWIRKLVNVELKPTIEVIDIVDKDNWEYWEKFYISYFKFIGCELTNGTHGGDQPPSTKGRKHTLESRLKMSKSKKGKPIPWLNNGSERTEEHRYNLSVSCKGRKSPIKGKKFNEEHRKKLSDASTSKKRILQFTKSGEFIRKWDSIEEAEKTLQIQHISEVCRNKKHHKTTGGYIWKYE